MSDLVVALGPNLYRVQRPWGSLPPKLEFTLVSGVAVDAADRVYVCQRGDPPVFVFDPSGEYIESWGTGVIADPHLMNVSEDGKVWVVDRDAHQVLAFNHQGHLLLELGERHRPRFGQPFNHPADVVVGPEGDIFVADGYGNSTVHHFSAEGELIDSWGSPGTGNSEFTTPHSICLDSQGRLLVADRENNRLQLFDTNGRYLDEWLDFYHPMDIYVDRAGFTYVTDQIPRLSMLEPNGRLVGRARPVLYGAHGVWRDSHGDFYLAEGRPANRMTKLVFWQPGES